MPYHHAAYLRKKVEKIVRNVWIDIHKDYLFMKLKMSLVSYKTSLLRLRHMNENLKVLGYTI